jgi:hypothetical protein
MKIYERVIKLKKMIEKIIAGAIKTTPIVVTANQIKEEIKTELPVFEKMTKAAIEEWASSKLGVKVDIRKTKAKMIEELKKHL